MSKKNLGTQGDGGGRTQQCPVCGAENAPEAAECSECSFTFEARGIAGKTESVSTDTVVCAECGAELPAGTDSCFICGAEVRASEKSAEDDWDPGVVGGDAAPETEDVQAEAEEPVGEPIPTKVVEPADAPLGENEFRCPACGKHLSIGTSKCTKCWEKIPEMIRCPKCSRIIPLSSEVCAECFAKLKNGVLIEETEEPVQEPAITAPTEEETPDDEIEEHVEEITEVFGVECPFCKAMANPSDDICPECGMPLIEEEEEPKETLKVHKKPEHDWYRITAILVVVILLVSGILPFALPLPQVDRMEIRIDGAFGDWDEVGGVNNSALSTLNPNVDIESTKMLSDTFNLYFFMDVRGEAFGDYEGNTARIFIDDDRSSATGYSIMGIGADYQIRVFGHDGNVESSSCMRFEETRAQNDFNGFVNHCPSVPHASQSSDDGDKFEVRVALADLGTSYDIDTPFTAVFYMADTFGDRDYSDAPQSNLGSVLFVRQTSLVPDSGLLTGNAAPALSLDVRAIGHPVSGITFNVPENCFIGTYLHDMQNDTSQTINITADAPDFGAGNLINVELASSDITATEDGTGSDAPTSPHIIVVGQGAYAYATSAPTNIEIDGAFADWSGQGLTAADALDDVMSKNGVDAFDDPGLDMVNQTAARDNNMLNLLVQTAGQIMAGMWVPAIEETYVDTTQEETRSADDTTYTQPDVERTRAPEDIVRPASATTPAKTGESYVRIYIDSDNDTSNGYAVEGIGADYLVVIAGQNGKVTDTSISVWSGTDRNVETWTAQTGVPEGESSGSMIEIGIPLTYFADISENATSVIQLIDWNHNGDVADIALWDVFETGTRSGTRDGPTPPGYIAGRITDDLDVLIGGATVILKDSNGRATTTLSSSPSNNTFNNYIISQEISYGTQVKLYSVNSSHYGTGTATPSASAVVKSNITMNKSIPNHGPTGLQAKAYENGVSVSWTAAATPTSFNIFRTSSTTTYAGNIGLGKYYGVKMATVTGDITNYMDTTAIQGITYYYFIESVFGTEFHYSQEVSILADYSGMPVIQHDSFTEYYASSVPVKATITDDVGVTSASVYYRNAADTSWSSVPMSLRSGTSTSGDWEAWMAIDNQIQGVQYQYYITAEDGTHIGMFGGPGGPGYPVPLNFTAGQPQDPYPLFGYVKWADGTPVGGNVPVSIRWTDESGVYINHPTEFPTLTDSNSAYTLDLLNYDQNTHVWGNATAGGIWGYNETGMNTTFAFDEQALLPTDGGRLFNITLNTPLIGINKTAPATAAPTQIIAYTVTVTNTGNSTAYNINVTETYPPEVIYQSAVPLPTFGNNVWIIPILNVTESYVITINVQIDGATPFNTTVVNNVYANWTNYVGVNWGTVNASASTLVTGGIANLEVSKSAPATVNPGGTMTYSIQYWNNGTIAAENVWINESYSPWVSYVSSIPAPFVPNTAWFFATIAAGTTGWINITVHVDDLVPTGIYIYNNITGQYDFQPDVSATARTLVIDPSMEIVKSGPAFANAGQQITYTITYWNNGTDWAHNVVITETYPAGVTFVSSIPAPTIAPDTWNVGSVGPGGTNSIQVTVLIDPAVAIGTVLTNRVDMSYSNIAIPRPIETDFWNTTIVGPTLLFSKTAPATANAGEVIMYTLTVTNIGSEDALNVWVTETYPAGVTYLNATPAPTIGNNRWLLGTIPAGEFRTIFINVTVNAGFTGALDNTATMDFTDDNGIIQPTQWANFTTVVANPYITVEKTGPSFANHGETIMYTIIVQNIGTDIAYNVVVTETYPADTTFVNSNPVPTVPNNIWNLGNLNPGETRTIFINVTVLAAATSPLLNSVSITYRDAADQNLAPAVDTWPTILRDPVVSMSKTAPANANSDQDITYTINYANTGNDWARNVVITESYPAGVTFVSSSPVPSIANDTWNIGDLAPGASGTITITVHIDAGVLSGTVLTNWAYLNHTNNASVAQPILSDSASTLVNNPYMTLSKSAPAFANPGETITYTIAYTNTGSADALNVVIEESYPAGVTFVSATPAPTIPNFRWVIGTVAPGASASIDITVTIDAAFTGTLVNTAWLNYTNGAGQSYAINATAQTVVTQPIMSITKTAPMNANAGQTIMYTIFYQNTGSETAYNVTITETYPANVTFANSNPAPTIGNNVWVINNVSVGGNGTIFINVTISTIAEGLLWNQVTLDYEDAESNSMPQEAADAVTILTGPYVTIEKTAPAEAHADETFVYTLAVTNWGTAVAENLVITETYPAWLTIVSSDPVADMGNNVWYIASLAAGTTVWINITVLVSDIAPLGTLLTNSVTLDYENAAGTVLPQESDSATTVIVGPIVLMDKTAPAFANTGETITYTIAWQVFGTDNATNVYINETYPVGITFVSAVPAPTTGTNVWFLGNLAPGSSGIITITVLVTATVGTLVNTAVLEHSNGFMQMPDITDSAPTQIRNPLIQIVKDGPTEAAPGQIITYTITYDNVGTDWAYDVTITETYPAGVTFISAIPAPTSGNNVWFIGDLAAGASGMIEITVQINLTATGTLVNFVEAEYNNTVGPVSPVNTTSPPMDIVNCQVTLEKEGPAQANTGQTFTYWLNYTNIGSDTAYDVTITETYPAGVTFISAVPPPTSGTNVWFIGTISPGAVGSIAITVSVLPGATGILHNFADVTGENVGGIEIPVTEATLDTLIIDPLLTVTKTGPATAVPGQQITYTITVQNTGTSPALNVWVTDTYPAGFTYVSSSIAPWNLGTGDNIWYFASIAASGSVSFTITVQIPGTADGTYINTAVAEYRNGFRDMTPVTGTWNTVVSGPYMDITKTAPATANEGEIITYTINYINMGSGTAFNVVITETYPAGITFISAIPAPSNPGAGDNIWNIGNLVAGASGTITIQVSVNLGATLLVNNVTVEYQDASVANYQDWAEATTLVAGPLLEIEKTGPATANTGEEITYTITVTNLGTDTAANVVVTETYPAGVTFVSSNPVPSNPGAGDNIWNIGLVAIGIANQVTITITVRVNNNAAGILHNLAVADYTNTVNTPWPPVEATWDTLVIDPTASLSKWAPAYANTGEFITYYLNYSVGGTDSAYNVWINETYPVGITFISAVPAPTSGTNVWNLGTLPIGTSGSIAITVQVTAASGTLVNNANLEFQNGFRQMADVPASATTIIRNPVLTLDKTAPATAVAGQTITYMITIHNSGNDFAYNVIVTEAYPLGVSFVSALPMPTFGNNVWSIPFIAPDGTVIIEITVEIDPTVTWNLVNNVAATWENAAGISLTPLADQATTVIQAPNMSVTKTGPASATYWQTITYTITYFNNGSAPAENVWVIDVLPAGVTLIGAVPSPTVGTSWFIGTVAPGTGASIIVTVRIEPTAPASITNWATLTYENSAAVTFPDEVAQWTTDIVYPMMTLVKTAPATANTGENITYTLTYTNTGTATAHNLVITETYHPGVDFVSAVPAPSVGDNVWWVATVLAGTSLNITITVQVTATSGWVNNTAVLEYTTQFGHEMPDVQAGAPTQVINPLMTLEKTAPSSANRGDFITYTLTYTNIGNDVAYNVTITETYPADVTFMSAIPVPTNSGAGDNIWNIGNVPAGMSVSINITVRILFTAGTSVINRATLEYSNAAGIEQPQVNATAETAVGDPLLTIDKTGPATANIGSLITYTIYYVNIGDGTAYNVIISENYDPFVTFVSAVPAPSIGNNIWNVGTLSPGEGGWINVTVRVLTGAVVIENWAHADYRNAANVQQLRVSDNHFTGVTGPFLTVAKDGPAMANTGQTITYTITVENLGDAAAENVWVNDTYPAGVTFVSAVPAPVIGSGNATWFFATIAAGATVVITVNVLVQVSAVGILVNTVTVGYENTEGQPWPDVNDTVETLVNDPYVVITKTGPIQTNPGSQITYSITVSNIGPATAYNVTVTETYPALTAFFDATPYPTTGNNVWYIGTLAPNATYVIWVTVNVSMSATVGIANRVTVTYRDTAGQAKPTDTAWWNTSIVNPLLVIYKTAPATANPGQNITYTLWVENVGTAWAIDVIVREYYPANVTFVSATIAPYLLFDNVWFIPALAPGDSWSVDITVHISLLATGTLVNNATVTYENEVGTILPVEWDTASTDIISPGLAIVKTAPAEANPGEIITYTVTVTNNGDAPAYNVVVEEIYPAGVTYITATIAPRPLTTNFWDIGTLNPGASWSVTITVQVNTDATGTLINTAIATYYNEAGMAMDPVTIYAITNVTLPQMQFEKTAPATANTGQTVTYSLRYRNVGTDAAYDVTITESYPAGVSFLSSVPAPIFPTDNQWYFATVPADGIWHYINITVLVSTTASGWLLNSATLDYESGVDIARPRLVATALTHIDDPLITMVKTAPQYANSGEAITYSIYYWNNGTADAYNVWINETYPAGVAYQSAIPAPAPANNTWNIGTLAVGASGIITITVTVNANAVGALVNLAICEYDDGSGEPQLPVEATATTTVVDPYLTISKSAPSAANSGQTITYTITIQNLGDAPAYNVIVQETYPAGVSYVSYISTGAPTQMSDSVWLFAMIAPGNTVTLTITVIIDANVADGTLLTNTVDASYEDANGELQVPIRDTATTLIEDPILTITKTGSTTAVVGGTITYTVTVTNTGTGWAYNVTVTDSFPASVSFISSTPARNMDGTWTFSQIAAGGTETITITVQVDPLATDSVLTNWAYANYTDAAGQQQPTVSDSCQTVLQGPFMTITKTASVTQANPGQTFTYTITYQNVGLDTAQNVWVVESYPAGVTFVGSVPAPSNPGAGDNLWGLGNLAPGATGTITITVTVNAGFLGMLSNVATIYYNNTANVPQTPVRAMVNVNVINPLMTIEKTGPATSTVGAPVMYTIHYENTGTDTAQNVVITESYPAGTVFVNSNPVPTVPNTIWNIGNVAPGQSGYIFINVTFQANIATHRINNVTLGYENLAGIAQPTVWDTVDTLVPIPATPLLAVSKTAPATASVSEIIMYTITVTNIGTVGAIGVTVTESYDPSVTFVNATPAPSVPNTIWNVGNLAASASYVIYVNVSVNVGASGTLVNNVTVSYTGQPNEYAEAYTDVIGPAMSVYKSAPAMFGPTGNMVYTITYENTGTDTAYNVVITETYPGLVTFFSAVPAPDVPTDNVWTIASVPAGGVGTITINVVVAAPAGSSLVNSVTLDYETAGGYSLPQESASATTLISQVIMTITKTAPLSANPGDTIEYVITIQNPSLFDAVNVLVTETFPALTTVVGLPIYGIIAPDIATPNTWFYNTIPAGQGTTITLFILIDPTATGTLVNNVQMDYTDNLANSFTIYARASTTVSGPMLQIQKTAPATASPGALLLYTITVTNIGPGIAANVVVTETYPSQVIFISSTPAPSNLLTGANIWNLGSINPGQTRIITITVRAIPSAFGTAVNRVAASYQALNGTALPDVYASASTVFAGPSMTVSKTGPEEINPGQTFMYTITYRNIGSGQASNVRIQDVYPAGLTPTASSVTWASHDVGNRRITWTLGTVAAGATVSLTVTFTATGVSVGTFLTNTAYLNYTNGAGAQLPTQISSFVTRVTDAVMTIDKTGPANANSGEYIQYVITYFNSGNSYALNVVITESYPVGVTFDSSIPAPSVGNNVWNIASVAPGTGGSITVRVMVNADVPSDTMLNNTATLDYRNAAGTVRPQVQDSAITTVLDPLLSIVKNATATTVNNGTVSYTINVTNIGMANAENVVVTENYPAEVTFIFATVTPSFGSNVWLIGTLTPGESWLVTITVMVTSYVQGNIVNFAYADYEDAAREPQTQVSANATTFVADPMLVITKTASPTVSVGGTILYEITLENIGQGDAYNVVLTDIYALGTTFLNSSEMPDGPSNDTWTLPVIPAGWYGTLFINVTVSNGSVGTLVNTALVDYEDVAGNTKPQLMAEAMTRIVSPLLTISKTGPATAYHGEVITYTVTIRNIGDGNATGISVADLYPSWLTYVSSSVPPTFDDYIWNFTVLAPGENITFTVSARLGNYSTNVILTAVMNRVFAYYSNEGGIPQDFVSANFRTSVIWPQLTVEKTGPATAPSGATIQYTISYTNIGDGWASLITLTETYPAGTAFVSAVPAPTSGNNVWTFANMAPGQSGTIVVTLTVTASFGTSILNTVNLQYRNLIGQAFPAVSATWTTMITGGIEQQPPMVTSIPLDFVWAGEEFVLSGTVISFDNANIVTVILYFTNIDGTQWSAEMSPYDISANRSGIYRLADNRTMQPYKGFVSYFIWVEDSNGNENRSGIYDIPVRLPPYFVWGTIYSAQKESRVTDAIVQVTDQTTFETVIAITDGNGMYQVDLATLYSGYMHGEALTVNATDGLYYGGNSSAVIDLYDFDDSEMEFPNRQVDVILSEIPEFTAVVLPIIAVLVLVVLFRRKRRKTENAASL